MPKETASQCNSSVHWLTQRNNGAFSQTYVPEKYNILIFDLAADQYTGGGPAWDIAYCSDKFVNCYKYLKDDAEPIVHMLSIVGVCTVITPPTGSSFIALVHQISCNKLLHQNESLALTFKLMNHGMNFDFFLSCYTAKDGTNGTQSFTIDGD